MKAHLSRRAILGAIPAALAQTVTPSKKLKPLPAAGEFVRLVDPTTEATVVRLTSLSSEAYLPRSGNRFVSAKDRFLIFCSNRSGRIAPYRLDLRNGVIQQLSEGSQIDTKSLSLDPSEKSLFLLDSGQLKELNLGNRQSRTVTEGVSEFVLGASQNDLAVLRDDSVFRLDGRLIAPKADHVYLLHPTGSACVFGRQAAADEREFWLASNDGASCKLLAHGMISCPYWSPSAASIVFLRESSLNGVRSSQIMELQLDTLQEAPVSIRSQLVSFAPNRNGSVFVGALQSKAQPTITLLLKSPAREITLCEHHASNPSDVSPVFAPDSRRIYFESDREGKPAIYSVNVELLVEST